MTALQRLWRDRMDIYRWEEKEIDNVTVNEKHLAQSDVKCHYSKGSLSSTGEDGVPVIINTQTLFCGLDTDLQEGDEAIVTQRKGKQVALKVGEGFPYSSHQEFKVKRSDMA